jgi:hypothetical protein
MSTDHGFEVITADVYAEPEALRLLGSLARRAKHAYEHPIDLATAPLPPEGGYDDIHTQPLDPYDASGYQNHEYPGIAIPEHTVVGLTVFQEDLARVQIRPDEPDQWIGDGLTTVDRLTAVNIKTGHVALGAMFHHEPGTLSQSDETFRYAFIMHPSITVPQSTIIFKSTASREPYDDLDVDSEPFDGALIKMLADQAPIRR